MRSRIPNPTRARAALLLAAAFLLAGVPALADSVEGEERLVEKHVATLSLEIEDGLRIQTSDDTWIYDFDLKRIFFHQIPDPSTGPVMVHYKGRLSGNTIHATRLLVGYLPE